MKHLIIMLAEVMGVVALAANLEPAAVEPSPTAVMCVAKPTVSEKDRKEAARCGVKLEDWCRMSKKARKAARQEALAKEKGMTVAEMKAEANRKAAEKAGCPAEQWAKMSVKERCAYRKAKAQGLQKN